jgi:hypothetical protein
MPSLGADNARLIGTNTVKGETNREPHGEAALEFLHGAEGLRMHAGATYDWHVYYRPYFRNYFADIERLYANVAEGLSDRFQGFVVVTNNTYRSLVVPVDAVVAEAWRSLGFDVRVHATRERFHVGTKNPRARGLRAKHSTYALEIRR